MKGFISRSMIPDIDYNHMQYILEQYDRENEFLNRQVKELLRQNTQLKRIVPNIPSFPSTEIKKNSMRRSSLYLNNRYTNNPEIVKKKNISSIIDKKEDVINKYFGVKSEKVVKDQIINKRDNIIVKDFDKQSQREKFQIKRQPYLQDEVLSEEQLNKRSRISVINIGGRSKSKSREKISRNSSPNNSPSKILISKQGHDFEHIKITQKVDNIVKQKQDNAPKNIENQQISKQDNQNKGKIVYQVHSNIMPKRNQSPQKKHMIEYQTGSKQIRNINNNNSRMIRSSASLPYKSGIISEQPYIIDNYQIISNKSVKQPNKKKFLTIVSTRRQQENPRSTII